MQESLRELGHQNYFSAHLKQSVTLKMDMVHPFEMPEQTQTTLCENGKNDHHQEGLKTYSSLCYW
jgi:hypothetical protein